MQKNTYFFSYSTNILKNIALLGFLVLFMQCGGGATDVATEETGGSQIVEKQSETLNYEMMTLEKTFKDCNPANENTNPCTYIRFQYPVFKDIPNDKTDFLNALVLEKMLEDGYMPKAPNLTEVMDAFIQDYADFQQEMPDMAMAWSLERNINLYYHEGEVVCLSMAESSFMGGAHPNSFQVYFNVNLNTGKILTLEDILNEGYQEQLNELVDKYFRDMLKEKLGDEYKDTKNLTELGLFVDKIEANDNFAITEKGIAFAYNAYEIGPYSAGSFECLVPYEALKPLLKTPEKIVN